MTKKILLQTHTILTKIKAKILKIKDQFKKPEGLQS